MTVFLTGFPGFLGSALVERLLGRGRDVTCLVQPKYRTQAEERAAELAGDDWRESLTLYDGDITDSSLSLDAETRRTLQREATDVFHLAAVYDLGVDREVGMAVNVRGTKHVLAFAEGCPNLQRFQYVSTCYVSGRHDGVFTESDLHVGQSFNNAYEETKYLAEVAVQRAMAEGLPTTIYRPAIVVGDSETGATQKYDGPYSLVRLLSRQPRVAVVPLGRGAERCELNVVPRNYVVDAIDHLSGLDRSANRVYQLCDPAPLSVPAFVRCLAAAMDRRAVTVPVGGSAGKRLLDVVPQAANALRVDPETLDYLTHPTRYVDGNARRDLAGTDIACPPIAAYAPQLVEYVRAHPEISSDAMV
ncbi:Male sterility domain-containing protein [Haloprofundus marisrubri]|uniref:Male sterility domain-containing protein n=1 Tax=Haloprofundus marisrubri TaxID=1514971 RepID=A0A0W1R765_9EURY|nr:SDR family oxidoreductase [Haloprofundus marisrubri]KTG09225.1 Male sterility domain-containing protein [Haloprofundus marisrubri]